MRAMHRPVRVTWADRLAIPARARATSGAAPAAAISAARTRAATSGARPIAAAAAVAISAAPHTRALLAHSEAAAAHTRVPPAVAAECHVAVAAAAVVEPGVIEMRATTWLILA